MTSVKRREGFSAVTLSFIAFAVVFLGSCPAPLSGARLSRVNDTVAPTITVSTPANNSDYYETMIVDGIVADTGGSEDAGISERVKSLRYRITTVLGSSDYRAITMTTTGSFVFTFSTAEYDDDIAVELEAVDWNDNKTVFTVRLKDSGNEMPSFVGTAASKAVRLEWTGTEGVATYDLYYTSNGTVPSQYYGQKITNATSPVSLSALKNGDLHVFRLKANKTDGTSVESGLVYLVPQSSLTMLPLVVS
ncbi:MAG: hypothetical protein WCT14_20295, partial [Treponemataceae bacterium]